MRKTYPECLSLGTVNIMKGNSIKGGRDHRYAGEPPSSGQLEGYSTPDRGGTGRATGGGVGGGSHGPPPRLTHSRTEGGLLDPQGNVRDGRGGGGSGGGGQGAAFHGNGLHNMALQAQPAGDHSRPLQGGGGGGVGGEDHIHGYYDRGSMLRGARHHSSPHLQHMDEDFRGGYPAPQDQNEQQQHRHHHGGAPLPRNNTQQHHPHQHRHPQQQHQQHQQHRHHPPDIQGQGIPVLGGGAVWAPRGPGGNGVGEDQRGGGSGGSGSRPPPLDPTSVTPPSRRTSSTAGLSSSGDGTNGGISGGGSGAIDFSQLPSSPEHMGLKAHAAEFVPGGAGGGGVGGGPGGAKGGAQLRVQKGAFSKAGRALSLGSAATTPTATAATSGETQPNSDLTAYAQEFVPGGARGKGDGSAKDAILGKDGASAAGAAAGRTPAAQKMVEVVRGGAVYFVPESEALAADELVDADVYLGVEEHEVEGFSWAHESTALPAPQRRTMHRYCGVVPKNVH